MLAASPVTVSRPSTSIACWLSTDLMRPSELAKVTVKAMPTLSSQVPSMKPIVVASEQLRQYAPVTWLPRITK